MDVEALRADTPGCATVTHFNSAGASLMPRPVLRTMTRYLEREAAFGGYEVEEEHSAEIADVYSAVAALVNGRSEEIALLDSSTRAWDMAFWAIPFAPGDRILTTSTEYSSNYIAFLQLARRLGVEVEVIPDTVAGEIDVAGLTRMLDENVRLIAVNHMPTNGGLVNPAAAIGRVARDGGIPYLLDACQTVGQMPIDVETIGCDFLTGTSRKYLRGPRGVGFLYVRAETLAGLEPPHLDNHSASWVSRARYEIRPDARRFELWESDPAARLGFGAAVRYAVEVGLDAIWERILLLSTRLRDALDELNGVRTLDLGTTKGALVTFVVEGHTPREVARELRELGINVSTSTPFSARLDMERRELDGLVRASVHYFNTEQEVDRLVAAVAGLRRRGQVSG